MAGEHSLSRALRGLLNAQRVAALGTLDDQRAAFVSMVPFAIDPLLPCLVIHVSGLAAHTRNLLQEPRVSLLVMQPEQAGEAVHALPRVSLDAVAEPVEPGSAAAQACRSVYLQRFPEAEPMTALGDFRFVRLHLRSARQVAGFGAARSLEQAELDRILGPSADA